MPATHGPLQPGDGNAVALPKRPEGHGEHAPDLAILNNPTPHVDAIGDVDPDAHAYPALQLPLQFDDTSPAAAPYDPASHGPLHAAVDSPVLLPYCPIGQLTHTPAPPKL